MLANGRLWHFRNIARSRTDFRGGRAVVRRILLQRPSLIPDDDDYDVLADGVVVGRIMRAAASPEGSLRMRPLLYDHHERHTPTTALAQSQRRNAF